MADAQGLGPCGVKSLEVQVLSRPPLENVFPAIGGGLHFLVSSEAEITSYSEIAYYLRRRTY